MMLPSLTTLALLASMAVAKPVHKHKPKSKTKTETPDAAAESGAAGGGAAGADAAGGQGMPSTKVRLLRGLPLTLAWCWYPQRVARRWLRPPSVRRRGVLVLQLAHGPYTRSRWHHLRPSDVSGS